MWVQSGWGGSMDQSAREEIPWFLLLRLSIGDLLLRLAVYCTPLSSYKEVQELTWKSPPKTLPALALLQAEVSLGLLDSLALSIKWRFLQLGWFQEFLFASCAFHYLLIIFLHEIVKLLMAGNICMNKYFASCAPIRKSPSRDIVFSCSHSLFLRTIAELHYPAWGTHRWHFSVKSVMITE